VEFSSVAGKSGPGGPEGLIPPLFYTHEIQDPLMQPDLRDNPLTAALI
jgi:hypothetical protein